MTMHSAKAFQVILQCEMGRLRSAMVITRLFKMATGSRSRQHRPAQRSQQEARGWDAMANNKLTVFGGFQGCWHSLTDSDLG